MNAKLLLCDDDKALLDLLALALGDAGFSVETARDGARGWALYQSNKPDLVILDLIMPELDGLELCKRIRAHGDTPVVMLTSKDEELDKVLGLELGADDYVTKPFSTRELIARLRAVLRRLAPRNGPASPRRVVDRLAIDRDRRAIELHGQTLVVTATEFELLWALTESPGVVYTRDQLIAAVYGESIHVSDRTIDTFVKRLRKKMKDVAPDFDPLEAVRGVGYRYQP